MILWITAVILAIVLVTGILMVLIVRRRKKEGKPVAVNYRAFFIMGVIWTPIGIISMTVYFILQIPFYTATPIFVLGLIYLALGLANRAKWPKRQ